MVGFPRSLESDAVLLIGVCESELDLASVRPPEAEYASVPLCVIDAVWSIGVRYEGVRNVVANYSAKFSLPTVHPAGERLPKDQQQSVSDMVNRLRSFGEERGAHEVFQNRQRTSPRGGILKSQAVVQFGEALAQQGVERFEDLLPLGSDSQRRERLERAILAIPGQRSGLSLRYFSMLAGADHLVKPDRHVLGFLHRGLGRWLTADEAQEVISAACGRLRDCYPTLTPRLLDHAMWVRMRGGRG